MIYLDTHVVVMLHAAMVDLIPQKARSLIESSEQILISPMAQLELQFLHEIGRIHSAPTKILHDLAESIGLQVCPLPFATVAAKATHELWTRDPFDRIITAQARIDRVPLLTKDRVILEHYAHALWAKSAS